MGASACANRLDLAHPSRVFASHRGLQLQPQWVAPIGEIQYRNDLSLCAKDVADITASTVMLMLPLTLVYYHRLCVQACGVAPALCDRGLRQPRQYLTSP